MAVEYDGRIINSTDDIKQIRQGILVTLPGNDQSSDQIIVRVNPNRWFGDQIEVLINGKPLKKLSQALRNVVIIGCAFFISSIIENFLLGLGLAMCAGALIGGIWEYEDKLQSRMNSLKRL